MRPGTLPGGSGQQAEARQALDAQAQDRLIRAGGGQADPDTLLEFINAGGDLDQAQAEGVELGGAPGRPLGQGRLERPDQPVRRGVQEQAELVGRRPAARGAVGRQVPLIGFDVVRHLATGTVGPLIQALAPAGGEVGHDEADIDALVARFDADDDAPDPRPAFGAIVEFGEAADLRLRRQCRIGGRGRGLAVQSGLGQGSGAPMKGFGAGQAEAVAVSLVLAPAAQPRFRVLWTRSQSDRRAMTAG
jgi:hypothetical protein